MRCVSHTVLTMAVIMFSRNAAAEPEAVCRESVGGGPAVHHGGRKTDVRMSAGYWNDNFAFDTPYDRRSGDGGDDFHTASIWVQLAAERSNTRRFFDLYYHLLTDRKRGIRTDLFAFRVLGERETRLGIVRAGAGIVACGDFGGARLQNGYHRLFHYVPIDLPYAHEETPGLIVLLRHGATLLKKGRLRFGTYEAGYYRSAVIPTNCRAGLDGVLALPPFQPFRSLCLHAICGGTSYFGRRTFLSPLFESGFTWGMLLSGTLGRTNRISTWFTNNQYGLHQLQFGLALTFGNDVNSEMTLHDFTFP